MGKSGENDMVGRVRILECARLSREGGTGRQEKEYLGQGFPRAWLPGIGFRGPREGKEID